MPTIPIISQKGRRARLHSASVARNAGAVALVIGTDPQATASQWAARRGNAAPEVIDSPPPRLAKVAAAQHKGAQVIESEPAGKAADEVRGLYKRTCRQLDIATPGLLKAK